MLKFPDRIEVHGGPLVSIALPATGIPPPPALTVGVYDGVGGDGVGRGIGFGTGPTESLTIQTSWGS